MMLQTILSYRPYYHTWPNIVEEAHVGALVLTALHALIFCNYGIFTGKKQPFFLYMAFQHTHHPQFASKMFTNSTIRGPFGDSLVSNIMESFNGIFSLSEQAELDWQVGQIFDAINETGISQNTFVFFTSDNG